jgi:thiamine kinase-like enzyme
MALDFPEILALVAEAHSSSLETVERGGVKVVRIHGGANNALYRIETEGQTYACKLCVSDERRRAAREYSALRLLEDAGLDLAPSPVWFDGTLQIIPYPVVVYTWLEGIQPPAKPSAHQLAALIEGFQQIHGLQRHNFNQYNLPEAWFHWFDYQPYLAELNSFLARYGSWLSGQDQEGRKLTFRLEKLTQRFKEFIHTSNPPDPGRMTVSVGLCRVDPNRENCVWDSQGRIRWVDWEYSGWGDPALELADLRWHVSWMEVSEEQHTWMRSLYPYPEEDEGFLQRLAVWDRLVSVRWPFLVLRSLWNCFNGPDRERLSEVSQKPEELQRRMVSLLERAERFYEEAAGP